MDHVSILRIGEFILGVYENAALAYTARGKLEPSAMANARVESYGIRTEAYL